VGFGSKVLLVYNFKSIDPVTGGPTGDGSVTYTVNNKVHSRTTISQEVDIEFNPTESLVIGSNTVKISVTDQYGGNRTLEYTIEVVSVELRSNFNSNEIFKDDISLFLTPIGKVDKSIYVHVDDQPAIIVPNNTTGVEITVPIKKLSHGAHTIRAYFRSDVEGTSIESNELIFNILCIEQGVQKTIYKVEYDSLNVSQYRSTEVRFLIYDPKSSSVNVEIYENYKHISTQISNRTLNTVVHKFLESGSMFLRLKFTDDGEDIIKSINFNVEALDIDSKPVTEGLELHLTAQGKSNSAPDKDTWVYENFTAKLNNFNFKTNGWMTDDDGSSCLLINSNASVEIPIHIFSKDLRVLGKTVEIEYTATDVEDYEAVIIECMHRNLGFSITPQLAKLSSELSSISTQFKENERIRVSFVIQKSREDKLLALYVNGVLTGVTQYPENDSFLQSTPRNIYLAPKLSTLKIYNIRVYDTNLTEYGILDNYIYDMDNLDLKLDIYDKNRIYDGLNQIDYNKVINYIPCMTIVGPLPAFKGDKVKNSIIYENKQNPLLSFTAENVGNDVQGTSSQYYPRKNYKLKLDKKLGATMTETYEKVLLYKLRGEGDRGIRTICLKADFAESSSTHNTGIAKLMNDTMIELGLLTPPQKAQKDAGQNIDYRTCVDGYPIIVFSQETPTSERVFLGKYNFNADKGNDDYYGFLPDVYPECECIELLNNNSDRVVFRRSDFDEMGEKEGVPYAKWWDDFEFRYPDDDDMNEAFENGTLKPVRFKRLTDWLATTTDNPEKFRAEYKDYFHEDFLIFYHCVTELLGMVDQRAKNLFLTTWDGLKWLPIFYDNDTVLGVDNSGLIRYGFGIEYHDKLNGLSVWNDKTLSNIWANVDAAFAPEIKKMYARLRTVLTYDSIIEYMNTEQSDKWSESIYNEDAKFKYVDPLTKGFYDGYTQSFRYTGEYLPRAQGSRSEHRKWWLRNRFHYMDSKYNEGGYISDYATMRVNVPILIEKPVTPEDYETNRVITDTLAAVPSDTGFNITAMVDQYARVKYEHTEVSSRAYKGISVRLEPPQNFVFSDTNTIIYGASRINDLGDLAPKYPSYLSISSMINLVRLKVGDSRRGYNNANLKTLVLGNNRLLRYIDLRNCSGLSGALNLSGCANISEIYTLGTNISNINLPEGSTVTKIEFPNSIANLTLKDCKYLKQVEYSNLSNVSTVILENNNPEFSTGFLFSDIVQESVFEKLSKVRVLNLDNTGFFTEEMIGELVANCKGVDENGLDTANPVITGEMTIYTSDLNTDKSYIEDKLPNLNITWNELKGYVFEEVEIDGVEGYAFSLNSEFVTPESKTLIMPNRYNGKAIIELKDITIATDLERVRIGSSSSIMRVAKGAMIGTNVSMFDIRRNMRYVDLEDTKISNINNLEGEIQVEDNENLRLIRLNENIKNIIFRNCSELRVVKWVSDIIDLLEIDLCVNISELNTIKINNSELNLLNETIGVKNLIFGNNTIPTIVINNDHIIEELHIGGDITGVEIIRCGNFRRFNDSASGEISVTNLNNLLSFNVESQSADKLVINSCAKLRDIRFGSNITTLDIRNSNKIVRLNEYIVDSCLPVSSNSTIRTLIVMNTNINNIQILNSLSLENIFLGEEIKEMYIDNAKNLKSINGIEITDGALTLDSTTLESLIMLNTNVTYLHIVNTSILNYIVYDSTIETLEIDNSDSIASINGITQDKNQFIFTNSKLKSLIINETNKKEILLSDSIIEELTFSEAIDTLDINFCNNLTTLNGDEIGVATVLNNTTLKNISLRGVEIESLTILNSDTIETISHPSLKSLSMNACRNFKGLNRLEDDDTTTVIRGAHLSNISLLKSCAVLLLETCPELTQLFISNDIESITAMNTHKLTSVNGSDNGSAIFFSSSFLKFIKFINTGLDYIKVEGCDSLENVIFRNILTEFQPSLEIINCKGYDSYSNILKNYNKEYPYKKLILNNLKNDSSESLDSVFDNWIDHIRYATDHTLTGNLSFNYIEETEEDLLADIIADYPRINFNFKPRVMTYGYKINVSALQNSIEIDLSSVSVENSVELTTIPKSVDWGDGIVELIDPQNPIVRHNYDLVGNYTVSFSVARKSRLNITQLNGITVRDVHLEGVDIVNQQFYNCKFLTAVNLPSYITDISSNAFRGCSNLESFRTTTLLHNIGDYAFQDCTSLMSFSLTSTSLQIGNYVFKNCTNLSSVSLPNSVTSIGDGLFYLCENLSTVNIPTATSYIGKHAFYGCKKIVSVLIPNGVTNILDGTFHNCELLESIVMSENITTIGNEAFYNCKKVRAIHLSSVLESIGDYAFYGCEMLTSLLLSDNVTSIGSYAFYDCINLVEFKLSNNLINTKSLAYTFYNCAKLTEIILPTLMPNLNSLAYTFYGCSNLTTVTLPSNLSLVASLERTFYNCNELISVELSKSMPLITSLLETFYGCSSLTSVSLPSELPLITSLERTFFNCSKIESLVLPKEMINIDRMNGAFYNCMKLLSVVLPEEMNNVYTLELIFYGCTNLTSITLPAKLPLVATSLSGTYLNSTTNPKRVIKYHPDDSITSKTQIKYHNESSGVSEYT
ncbi:MAG: leucine-rich repeat domain-containing protein, partial [Paraclostridium sp.]